MKKILSSVAGLTLLSLVGTTTCSAAFDDLQRSFASFYQTGLDTANALPIENLTIQKDAMTLVLKKGILIPMQPIEGEVTGAMFVGEGAAALTPPTPMDTWFLKKNYGAGKFAESFSSLYMRFTDGTDRAFPKPAPGISQVVVASQIDAITKTFKDRQGAADGWLDSRFDMDLVFMDTRIGGIRGMDYFYAQLQTDKWGWVTFMLSYGDIVEVTLGHERSVGAFKQYLPWAEFHKKEDYQQGRYSITPASDSKEIIDVLRNDMGVSIPTTKTVEIDAKLTVSPLVDSIGSLRFDLLNQFGSEVNDWRDQRRPIKVDSVTDSSGTPLPFLHKRNELLIRLPKPIPKGQQVTAESYLLYNDYAWYPKSGYAGGRYAFDFIVKVQEPLLPIGSGHIVREWEDKETKMNCVELRMDEQVESPSILFGRFQHDNATYTSTAGHRDIALSVYAFPTMSDPSFGTVSIPAGKMKGILEETQNVIKFYERIYGPFPFGDLQVAQMYPGSGFGQAPPSLVQLDGLAFASQADVSEIYPEGDMLHGLLSHEIAHQYWGHEISNANSHDEWLSEGFAEYASGLYVQALQGEKRFQQKRNEWLKSARKGDPQGPIALARILSGDNAFDYRQYLVYNKAPLVVHMIRMQMGNDKYTQAMQNILKKYKGQNITTEMLSIELSAVSGYNWDYFFEQWFRGVGIPEIHCKWKTMPKDGKYLFEMTATQKDAQNFKKILALPVVWKGSGKEQMAQKDFPYGQQGQVFQVILPFEPKEVEIDPNHNLLADIVIDK